MNDTNTDLLLTNLTLKRVSMSDKYGTFGVLIQDGVPFAATLEPILPIPPGQYNCTIYDSPRFKTLVYMLKEVPGHDYIEIHKGNFVSDTEGCILIGESFTGTGIGMSSQAFYAFMNIRMKGIGGFTLNIFNP